METKVESGALEPGATEAGLTAEELAAVRKLILRAYSDVVPELVTGATIAELTASIEPARAAYQRVVAGVAKPSGGQEAEPPTVPAGGATAAIDPSALPPAEKIRRGIAQASRQ